MKKEYHFITKIIEDYDKKKIEIDYLIETTGIISFLDAIEFLHMKEKELNFKNIILVKECNETLKDICFKNLNYLENYLKEIIYLNDPHISVGELRKHSLSFVLEIMLNNNFYNYINDDIDLTKILYLRKKILKNDFMVNENVVFSLLEMKKILPKRYKRQLFDSLIDLFEKYNFIDELNLVKEN